MNSEHLVSIIVIAYNSEQTIIETLESIKNQTYKNIELIVSDDCSKDATVELVSQWIQKNKEKFKRSKLIQSDSNKGITKNCNRGLVAAEGTFVKLIAADDILLDNCVNNLLEFCINEQLEFVFSKAMPFSSDLNSTKLNQLSALEKKLYQKFFSKENKSQFNDLVMMKFPLSMIIGSFYKREVVMKMGFFDEKYEMMEDYPFLIKLLKNNKLQLLNEFTVKYRIRNDETSENFKLSRRYIAHYNNLKEYRKNEILPVLLKKQKIFLYFYIRILIFLLDLENNQKNKWINDIISLLRKFKKSL